MSTVTPTGLLLRIFLWLPPCFALWYLLAGVLAQPMGGLLHLLLSNWLPAVDAVRLDGPILVAVTHYGELDGELVAAPLAGHQLALPSDSRLLSYMLPFYAAMYLAVPGSRPDSRMGWGLLGLCAATLFGLFWLVLKNCMVALQGRFLEPTALLQPPNDLIALFYQLSVLMLPIVAPVALWLWQFQQESPLSTLLAPLQGPCR